MSLHWRTDMDAVLRDAKADGRDILLWWTAPWCPPCNELDFMVFSQPAFAGVDSTMHLLKIEADAPAAQQWGDHFGLESYPALWLLSADAQPRMALPMATDPAGVLHAIELARQQRSLHEVAVALLQGEPVSAKERELVALHWWQQDRQLLPTADDRASLLSAACVQSLHDPASTQLRLLVHWLTALRQVPAPQVTTPHRNPATQLRNCLEAESITYADAYLLWVDPDQIAVLGKDALRVLQHSCMKALERQLQHHALQHTQRLVARFAQLQLAESIGLQAALPDLNAAAAVDAENAIRKVHDAREWVSVANMAGHLLAASGRASRAEEVFETAAREAAHPSYFLQYLGDLQLEAGRIVAGLDTWRQAYASSHGEATRFAMGVRLIHRLMKHLPDQAATIESTVATVLADVGGAQAATFGSNRRNLHQLQADIEAWQQQSSHAERGCDGASCPA